MKKLFKGIFLCLVLFSCKKDLHHQPQQQETEKKYEVKFKVSDFLQEIKGVAKSNSMSDAPANVTNFLTYIAYNSEGVEVSRIKQIEDGTTTRIVNDSPNEIDKGIRPYGVILDSLASGTHTIVVVASTVDFSINTPLEDFKFNPFNDANFHFRRSGSVSVSRAGDTFFKKFQLQIEETGAEHNVILDRIIAKAEFNIVDSKQTTLFDILLKNENEAFQFSNEKPFGQTDDAGNEEYTGGVVGGETNITFPEFVLNTETPIDVTINAYASYEDFQNGQVEASKTIRGVQFLKNKPFIFRGNIFSSSTTGFMVTVKDKFDADTGVVRF